MTGVTNALFAVNKVNKVNKHRAAAATANNDGPLHSLRVKRSQIFMTSREAADCRLMSSSSVARPSARHYNVQRR